MKQPAGLLLAACLAIYGGGSGSNASAAEEGLAAQELARPVASGKVTAAFWSRQEDSYSLQIMVPPFIGKTIACLRGLDPTFGTRTLTTQEGRTQVAPAANPVPSISADEMPQPGFVSVADALLRLVPQNISTYQPVMVGADVTDGAATMTALQRQPRVVQVWLLRADGTQILPLSRADISLSEKSCGESLAARQLRARSSNLEFARRFDDEIVYRFPAADSEQAVAAAIRIDDDYYIEKLQRLAVKQPGR